MKNEPNPTHQRGTISYDCPYLDDCRYHVALSNWQFWTCSNCPYRQEYVESAARFYPLTYRFYA